MAEKTVSGKSIPGKRDAVPVIKKYSTADRQYGTVIFGGQIATPVPTPDPQQRKIYGDTGQ